MTKGIRMIDETNGEVKEFFSSGDCANYWRLKCPSTILDRCKSGKSYGILGHSFRFEFIDKEESSCPSPCPLV